MNEHEQERSERKGPSNNLTDPKPALTDRLEGAEGAPARYVCTRGRGCRHDEHTYEREVADVSAIEENGQAVLVLNRANRRALQKELARRSRQINR